LANEAGSTPASLRALSTGKIARDTLARSTVSIARPKADDTCSRFAIRCTSAETLVPAPWNRAGLKNAASPLASGSWTYRSAKKSRNSSNRQAR
jgi:hypothetical protein